MMNRELTFCEGATVSGLVPRVALRTEEGTTGDVIRPARELGVVAQLGSPQLGVDHAEHHNGGGDGKDGDNDEEG